MPTMVKYAASHITRDRYDAIREAIGWEANPPAGALLHVASFDDTGGVQSFDVWEDRASADAYFVGRFLPALKALGVEAPEPAVLETYAVAAAPGVEAFILPVFHADHTRAEGEPRSFHHTVPDRPI